MTPPISLLLALLLGACAGGSGRTDGEAASGPASATGAPETELRVSTDGWSTDFSKHEVPLGEIIGGGPPKDGIPAIDKPRFAPIADVDWLAPDEPVIAVGIRHAWRAYPIQILVWHEIVNDTLAEKPITVTFCPLCHTAIAFSRSLGGVVYDFGTTGNLRNSDLVMYDRQTESWWQQATGRAIVGQLTGRQLEFLPSALIGWQQFAQLHPDGQALTRDTGYQRDYGANPYAGYDRIDSDPFLLEDKTLIDGRLSPKLRILGLMRGTEAVAYPFPSLADARVVDDSVADEPVVVLWAPGAVSGLGGETVAGGDEVGAAVAFSRVVDGRTLQFEPAGEGLMRDLETGSIWNLSGTATQGKLAGAQLELLPTDSPFWFAWAVFRPDTRIWQP